MKEIRGEADGKRWSKWGRIRRQRLGSKKWNMIEGKKGGAEKERCERREMVKFFFQSFKFI